MSNKRIDLTWFERFPQHDEEDCAIITDDTYALNWEVPKLIAELKRCYEELDEANKEGEALWNVLDNWDICMDDYSMHDLYNNLDEKYARNNEGRIILKELYSYTEEDGWQPKETVSE